MTDYKKNIEEWRKTQDLKMRAEDGWLSVVGLHWLKDGENSVGSGFGSIISLPKSTPAKLATIIKSDSKIEIKFLTIKNITLNAKPVVLDKNYSLDSDKRENPSKIKVGDVLFYLLDRPNGIGVRVKDPNSDARKNFKGRHWFKIDPKMRIEAKWVAYNPPKKILVPDVIGNMNHEDCPGEVQFELNGQMISLLPTQEDKQLFFVFRDGTSGKETYGASRFLYADTAKNGNVILDFNKAYNPPCAFTEFATCPLPPIENRLNVRIPAGELKTH